jgi:hypothetical protein
MSASPRRSLRSRSAPRRPAVRARASRVAVADDRRAACRGDVRRRPVARRLPGLGRPHPDEPPTINGEWAFIAIRTPEVGEAEDRSG